MNEGDIVLTPLPQADGIIKNRPAVFLREMPPFRDALVCGVSAQTSQIVPDFDELISSNDEDFGESGLMRDSLIRLGFLAVLPRSRILGSIGAISVERHKRLLVKLSEHLIKPTR